MRGRRLLVLAQHWFDGHTVANVFEPLLADWQRECADCRSGARLTCSFRGLLAFVTTFALLLARSLRTRLPAGLERSAWMAVAAFSAGGTALLMVPFVVQRGFEMVASLYLLLPSSLAMALPLATLPASVMVLTNPRWHPAERRRAVVRLTAVSLISMVAIAGWASPLANDAWRAKLGLQLNSSASSNVRPRRGTRELTLAELARRDPPSGAIDPHSRGREYHMRLVVITMPVTFTVLAFGISRRGRWSLGRVVACWLATPLLWLAAWFIATGWTRTSQQPDALVWVAPGLIALLGVSLVLLPPQRPVIEAADAAR